MAKLLMNWLNNDVKLSSVIYSLEEDFKDGYLLGELLYKYNQQLDFDKFLARDHPDSKIRNFCLVEPTMRNVGVNFGSKIAADIMAGRDGAIKTLLYELKTALDSIDRNSRQTTNPNLRGTRNDKILYSINPTKPSFDKTKSVSFENAIRTAAENPNDVMMRNALHKYKERKQDFRTTVDVGHSQMLSTMSADIQKTMMIGRTKKVNEGEFEDAWQSINLNQWKENQRVAKERRNLKKRVEFDLTQKKVKKESQISAVTREKTLQSLDEFDSKLEQLIVTNAEKINSTDAQKLDLIKTIQKVPGGGGPVLMYVDQLALKEGFDSSQKQMKEHHEDGINRQKMHDRRRRKFLREYDTMQTKLSHNFFEDDLVMQLLNECKDEVTEEETRKKVVEYQRVIVDNRSNRRQLVDNLQTVDSERKQLWEQVEASRELQWVVEPLRQSQHQRRQVLETATSAANRQQSIEVVSDVIDKILDMSAWIISCRLVGVFDYHVHEDDHHHVHHHHHPKKMVSFMDDIGECVLSSMIRKDAVDLFVSPLPVAEALPLPEVVDVSSALIPFSISQRPMCADPDWLFSNLLQSYQALSISETPASDEQKVDLVAAEEAAEAAGKSVSFWRPADKTNALTDHLADIDAIHFYSVVNFGQLPIGFDVVPPITINSSDACGEKDVALTPQWLSEIPSRFLLGETVVAIRCAVDPIPDEPSAIVDTSHIVLRCALCGVSDLQRQSLAEALKRAIHRIQVIKVEELIHRACLATPADNSEKSQAPVTEEEELDPESDEYKELAKLKQMAIDYDNLTQSIRDSLLLGRVVSDAQCVALIIHEIRQIPLKNNGFVIQDFPNTKAQLSLLMKEISGIDFESPRPNPADKASIFAPVNPNGKKDEYDSKKCGLDCVVYLHASNANPLEQDKLLGNFSYAVDERVTVRRNLVTGDLTYITPENCNSVAVLKDLYTPTRSVHTTGVDLTVAERLLGELVVFLKDLNLLDSLDISDYSSLSEAVEIKALTVRDKFIPADHLDLTYFDPPPILQVEVAEVVNAAAESGDDEDEMASLDNASLNEGQVDGALVEEGQAIPPPKLEFPPLRIQNSVPRLLASALAQLWSLTETQSMQQSKKYFTVLRDIRYEALQRRRVGYDCVNKFLVKIDNRQQLIHEFRVQFNSVSEDMRFDADCVAELGLRNLELCDTLAQLSETHRKEAEEFVKKFSTDAALQLMIHQSRCEAAALVQIAVHRFNTSLHLIFDYAKAVAKFDYTSIIANELEIALPMNDLNNVGSRPPSSKKGKEAAPAAAAAKKGKVDPNLPPPIVAFREPVLSSILPRDSMRSLPSVIKPEDGQSTPKDKKPPSKAKVEQVLALDPFDEIEKSTLELVLKSYSRETFTANRQLYGKDETLCVVVEHAVWFEAEKLKVFMDKVRQSLEQQIHFLEKLDKSLMQVLYDVIKLRFKKEIAANNVLYTIIQRAIDGATELEELWQVTPDANPINPRKFRAEALKRFREQLPAHLRQTEEEINGENQRIAGLNLAQDDGGYALGEGILTERGSSSALHKRSGHSVDGSVASGSTLDNDGDDGSDSDQEQDRNERYTYSDSSDDNRSRPSSSRTATTPKSSQSVPAAVPSNNAVSVIAAVAGIRKNVTKLRRQSTATLAVDNEEREKFKKEMAKYIAAKKRLEDKLEKRRHAREEEFRALGMSPAMAKLAAQNDLFLDEQHKMEDFDMINKPKHHRGGGRGGGGSNPNSARPKAKK